MKTWKRHSCCIAAESTSVQAAGGPKRADGTASDGLLPSQSAQATSFAQLPTFWVRMLQEDFDEVMRGYPDSAHSMDLVAEHRLRVLHSSEAWKSLATQQSLQTSGMRGKIQQALEVSTLLPIARPVACCLGCRAAPSQSCAAWHAGATPGRMELPWQTAAALRTAGTLLQRTCKEACSLCLLAPPSGRCCHSAQLPGANAARLPGSATPSKPRQSKPGVAPTDPLSLQEESQEAALAPKADLVAGDQLTVIKPPMIPRLRTSLDGSSPVAAPAARSSPKPARRTGAIGAYRATPLAAGGTRLNLASPNSGKAVLGRRYCLTAALHHVLLGRRHRTLRRAQVCMPSRVCCTPRLPNGLQAELLMPPAGRGRFWQAVIAKLLAL